MTTSGNRSLMMGTGIVVLIVGFLVAIGFWYSADQRESDAVRNLARAPLGCDTTLDFDAAGEFIVYVETVGRLDTQLAGDCAADRTYEFDGDEAPAMVLALTTEDGEAVELLDSSGVTYDAAGFSGESIRTFRIDTPGDHVLRVEAPDDPDASLAVAIGRDPSDGVGAMQLGAAIAAAVALLIGGALFVAARRKNESTPPADDVPAWDGQSAGWATTPPGAPVAPSPSGWAPAVGPPTAAPGSPPVAAPPPATGWPPQSAPTPDAPGDGAPWSAGDGSSGDGQRSPWAPPTDSAQ